MSIGDYEITLCPTQDYVKLVEVIQLVNQASEHYPWCDELIEAGLLLLQIQSNWQIVQKGG